MKIAIFTDTFLPQVNGVVTATLTLAKGLASRGHQVYIVCPRYPKQTPLNIPNLQIVRTSSIPATFYSGYRLGNPFDARVIAFIKKQKPDIIQFQTPLPLGSMAVSLAKLLHIPLIGTFHTLFTDPQYLKHAHLDNRPAEILAWLYARMFYDRCDLITAPTATITKELQKQRFTKPIIAISNGLDTSLFDGSNLQAAKQRYNPNGPLLLFVGRLAHEKNILYLLDCFALVVQAVPAVRLLVIGEGPQRKDVEEKIEDLNLKESVILAGEMAHNALAAASIYNACDIFVTASTTETQSITILEAQLSGLPTVAIAAGGVQNVVHHNYDGLLVANDDQPSFVAAVVSLLRDEALRRRLGSNALLSAQKEDIRHIIPHWEREYARLLANQAYALKQKEETAL